MCAATSSSGWLSEKKSHIFSGRSEKKAVEKKNDKQVDLWLERKPRMGFLDNEYETCQNLNWINMCLPFIFLLCRKLFLLHHLLTSLTFGHVAADNSVPFV